MRILSLELRNLNSLRGNWKLDFAQGALAESGLFAITGDTGAGKTTLLDALTLALYAKTPRGHEVDVRSRGASEAMAEVEFEGLNGHYRVFWSETLSGKKVQKIQSDRRLDKKNEAGIWEVVSSSKSEINGNNKNKKGLVEEITGLNYSQFCKSVLLPQGDFAAFLTADEGDRSAILERLTDTSIYSGISIAVFERHKVEKAKLDVLETRAKEHQLPTESELSDLQEGRKSAGILLEELKKEGELLQKSKIWIDKVAELEGESRQIELALSALFEKKEAAKADLDRLALHQVARPYAADLDLLEKYQQEQAAISSSISELQGRLAQMSHEKNAAAEHTDKLQSKLDALKNTQPSREAAWQAMAEADAALQLMAQKLSGKQADLDSIRLESEAASRKSAAQQQELATLFSREKIAKEWLADNPNAEMAASSILLLNKCRDTMRDIMTKQNEAKKVLTAEEKAQLGILEELQKAQKAFSEQEKKSENARARFQKLLQNLEAVGITGDQNEPNLIRNALESRIEHRKSHKQSLETLLATVHSYHKAIAESVEKIRNKREWAWVEEQAVAADLYSLVLQEAEWREELGLRRAIWERSVRIANWERERAALSPGEPCPLCGSLEHPYLDHAPKEFEDTARRDFERTEVKLQEIQQSLREKIARLKELSHPEPNLPAEMDLMEISEKIALEIQEALQQNESDIRVIMERITDMNLEWGQETVLEETISLLQIEIGELSSLKTEFDIAYAFQTRAEQVKSEFALKLQEKSTAATRQTEKIEDARVRLEELDVQFRQEETEVNTLLQPYYLIFSNETFKNDLNNLQKSADNYLKFKKEMEEVSTQKSRLEGEAAALSAQSAGLESRFLQEKDNIHQLETECAAAMAARQSKFGDGKPEAERSAFLGELDSLSSDLSLAKSAETDLSNQMFSQEGTLTALQKQLDTLQAKSSLQEKSLLGALSRTQFGDFPALRAAILPEDTAAHIEIGRQERERTEHLLTNQAQRVQTDLKATRAHTPDILDLEFLALKIAAQTESLENAQKDLGRYETQLQFFTEIRKRLEGLQAEIQLQSQTVADWASMSSMIGSADGKKFRKFAQTLTLRQLVQAANRHLEHLDQRYFIQKMSGDSLEMEILDRYQNNNTRPIKSLSGGETFLVSLALALGLSDMAGKRARIRSLFIDEGFGSLDETSLDMAVNALENLQSTGITIGVVSHVRALKERLGTKVVVQKLGNGSSTVEIVC